MGPNIKPFPRNKPLPEKLEAEVTLHAGDNITTDDIMPSDAKLLPYRSNIPHLANFCFVNVDKDFSQRCKKADNSVIIGGENYGQGSSREHAALAPLSLGVRFVIAKSFARIHRSNLINSGIVPLVFQDKSHYDAIEIGHRLMIKGAPDQIKDDTLIVTNVTTNEEYPVTGNFSPLEQTMLLAGGKINAIKGE